MSSKEYIEYLKDNPQGLWFKARWYGWGWVPVRWQGWVSVLAFVLILLANGFYFESKVAVSLYPTDFDLFLFFGIIFVSIIALFFVCYKKGEWPHWNWGDPRKSKKS